MSRIKFFGAVVSVFLAVSFISGVCLAEPFGEGERHHGQVGNEHEYGGDNYGRDGYGSGGFDQSRHGEYHRDDSRTSNEGCGNHEYGGGCYQGGELGNAGDSIYGG